MHFGKTYSQLLLSLPPELRERSIQYRQLKKLINQIVRELSSLGLSPALLQELLERSKNEAQVIEAENKVYSDEPILMDPSKSHSLPKIVYGVDAASGRIEPRLRLWVDSPIFPPNLNISMASPSGSISSDFQSDPADMLAFGGRNISMLQAPQKGPWIIAADAGERKFAPEPSCVHCIEVPTTDPAPNPATRDGRVNEVVIPLVSDTAFFQMLSMTIHHISVHLTAVESEFVDSLRDLSRIIGDSARPASSVSRSFHPFSATSNAGAIGVSSDIRGSDLYTWRELFQLYVEAEVFENVHEVQRGERSVEESESRLKLFVERVTQRGLRDSRKLKAKSRDALETFLKLNVFILHIKKFQHANAEAGRKILKKHSKRTALPEPNALILHTQPTSLSRVFVQAIGEVLLPIVPHLEDYDCSICTSIAFKPIRLNCGHLFCVRCLVKMQKRGKANCPMCRAPSVLIADRRNVDWALMNFMQDWFPVESKEKLRENEEEASKEQLEEMGIDPYQTCVVM